MNRLTLININGQFLADSREVADMTDKRHYNLVRDIDGYVSILNQTSDLRADLFFIESSYEAGTGKSYKRYLITKKGCDMVANKMTGEKGVLFTATYVTKFEEMEHQLNKPKFRLPQTFAEALEGYAAQLRISEALDNERKQLAEKIETDRPLVLYAESVQVSKDSILIGELAKLLKQNGIDIGGTRLFKQLREEGYLMSKGDQYNMPTQRSMDLKIMEIKAGTRGGSDGAVHITRTTKITGKGQIYFINKFKDALQLVK